MAASPRTNRSRFPLVPRRAREIARKVRNTSRRAYETLFSPRAEYHRAWRMTIREWLLYHQREIVLGGCSWMGLPAYKNPLDAWIYQEILHELRPDVIVEIGSAKGGSTLYLAHLLDLLGNGTVVSVDIDRSDFRAVHPRIQQVTGDSSSSGVLARVKELAAGKSVLVIHDGDHGKAQVSIDLEAYAPLVSPGSYLIVEDSLIDLFDAGDSIGTGQDGPLAAIEEFLPRHPEFAVDRGRERYRITYNPGGFLRRIH